MAFDNLPVIGSFLSWSATPHMVLLLIVLSVLLYTMLGKAMWTLMFITDPDRDCELRQAALSPEGVPFSVYAMFMLLWPLMLAVPMYRGTLFLGRHAPIDSEHVAHGLRAPVPRRTLPLQP